MLFSAAGSVMVGMNLGGRDGAADSEREAGSVDRKQGCREEKDSLRHRQALCARLHWGGGQGQRQLTTGSWWQQKKKKKCFDANTQLVIHNVNTQSLHEV